MQGLGEGDNEEGDVPAGVPQPLRIHPVYQLSGLSPHQAAFVEKKLIPAALRYIESILRVRRPVRGRLLLTRECEEARMTAEEGVIQCLRFASHHCLSGTLEDRFFDPLVCKQLNRVAATGSVVHTQCTNIPHARGNLPVGTPNADFILLVTSKDSADCYESRLATAGHCLLDQDTDRPVAGNINFCLPRLSNDASDWNEQLHHTIHELLHALGFSASLFPFFRDERGRTWHEQA
eukprot:jgi/Mesvir1/6265/Mv19974-RA.1